MDESPHDEDDHLDIDDLILTTLAVLEFSK